MKIFYIAAILIGSMAASSCAPNLPVKKIDLSEDRIFYTFSSNPLDHSLTLRTIRVTNSAIYDSNIKQKSSMRYVLPDYSKDAFFKESERFGLSQLRPVDFQEASITFSPLEFQDDITTTLDFETLDIKGKPLADFAASTIPDQSNSDSKLFPDGSECYRVTRISNNHDHVEYSVKNLNKSLKSDSHGNVLGYKIFKFGSYELYLNESTNINNTIPTPVIIKMGSRFFNATYHPRNTTEPSHDTKCDFYNKVAASFIMQGNIKD